MLNDFDARNVQPQMGGMGGHPPGIFPFTITNTYLKENSARSGAMLVAELTSDVGKIEIRFNVINPSAQAVEIAQKELSALCHAVNIFQVSFPKAPDGSPIMDKAGFTLRNGKGRMEVAPQMVKGPDGKLIENGYMEVKKVFDVNGNEPGKQPSAAPMTQQNGGGWAAQPQQQAPQQQPQGQPQQTWGNPPAQQPQQNAGWANPNAQPQQQPQNATAPQGGKPPWA